MVDPGDWRLQGQEKYLQGAQLMRRAWRPYPKKPDWDHDHCAFCWAKFSAAPDDEHEGYCTLDEYHWICATCFEDFREMFAWRLSEPPAP